MQYCISTCVTSNLWKKASTLVSSPVEARGEWFSLVCDFCILVTSTVVVLKLFHWSCFQNSKYVFHNLKSVVFREVETNV